MKKLSALILMVVVCGAVWGQTNQYPTTGNVSIFQGTSGARSYDVFNYNSTIVSRLEAASDKSGQLWLKNASGDVKVYLKTNGHPSYIMNSLGIGTSSPSTKLDVRGTIKADRLSLLRWYNPSFGHTNASIVMHGTRENDEWKLAGDGARSTIGIINTDVFGNMRFITHEDNQFASGKTMTDAELINNHTKMAIKVNGNVGIGTWAPKARLEVAGDIALSRAYKLKFLETVSGGDRAYIRSTNGQNGETYNSLIFAVGGGNERLFINGNTGNIGIGEKKPNATLDVAGNIKAHEIEVTLAAMQDLQLNGTLAANNITYTANGNTADFVFEDNYQLKDLSEVEAFIKTNKHLPEIPSAVEMEEAGVNLAEMNKLLLMKVEELTLYSIEKDKEVESLELKVEQVRSSESEVRKEIEKEREERRAMRGEMEKMTEDRRRETEVLRGEVGELKKLVMTLVDTQK